MSMKKEDLMKLGLDEEAAKRVEAASTEELKTYLPKAQFNEVNSTLQATLKERDKQLEALKNSTGDVDGLKKQIADLQAKNTEQDKAHAAEIRTLQINAAVDAALTAAKAKNSKAVKALLEDVLPNAELLEDGTIKGLPEQIKKLQGAQDSSFLFDTESKKATMKGASPAQAGKEAPDTKADVSKMSYEELAAYMEANPEAQL